MICKYCGNMLADNTKFCPNCGNKIEYSTEVDYLKIVNEIRSTGYSVININDKEIQNAISNNKNMYGNIKQDGVKVQQVFQKRNTDNNTNRKLYNINNSPLNKKINSSMLIIICVFAFVIFIIIIISIGVILLNK